MPALTLGPSGAVPVTGASISFTGSDPGRPSAVLSFRCQLDGAPFTACTSPQSLTGLAQGMHTFGVAAVDEAGNTSTTVTRTWRVDTILPTVSTTAPPVFTLGSTVGLHYTGTDGGSGVGSYDLRYRRAPVNGTFGAFTYPSVAPTDWTVTTATSVTLAAAKGYTYCLSVRARDKAGNLSGWSSDRCTAVALDDRSLTASTGWTRGTGSGYYAGTITSTTHAGSVLTRTGLQARRLSLVATRCGTVAVYWNGTLLRKISLNSTITAHKQLFTITDFGTVRAGTLTLKTLTTGSTRIDGLAASR